MRQLTPVSRKKNIAETFRVHMSSPNRKYVYKQITRNTDATTSMTDTPGRKGTGME